jgi:hypothetical protein
MAFTDDWPMRPMSSRAELRWPDIVRVSDDVHQAGDDGHASGDALAHLHGLLAHAPVGVAEGIDELVHQRGVRGSLE